MASDIGQVWCKALREGGTLREVGSGEFCFVVVPSRRVSALRFSEVLAENKVTVRILGSGSGPAINGEIVRNVVILASPSRQANLIYLVSRLCAVELIPVPMPKKKGSGA